MPLDHYLIYKVQYGRQKIQNGRRQLQNPLK